MVKTCCFLFLIILSLAGIAQQADSAYQLRQVEVTSLRLDDFTTGTNFDTLSEKGILTKSSSSVAEMLSSSGKLFVKSYGPGSLSSLSLNGSNASQTSILWNGFKIESPMLGQTDVSLLPACFTDDVVIQSGGRSDLWGSGSVGGSIHLVNYPGFNTGLKGSVQATLGSFSEKFYSAKIGYGSRKFYSSLAAFSHFSKNDYNYLDFFGKEAQQKHASYESKGLLSRNYFLAGKNSFQLQAWLQKSFREIPPSMTEAESGAEQHDQSTRLLGAWKFTDGRWETGYRIALFHETLVFDNAGPDSSSFLTWINEAQVKYSLAASSILLSVQDNYSTAEEDFYSETPRENTIVAIGAFFHRFEKIRLNFTSSLRQEWGEARNAPPVPSLGLEKKFGKCFTARMDVTRNFRYPTMNDRYWNPGGNPDLEPELGWGMHASVEYTGQRNSKIFTSTRVEGHESRIRNQIVWTPGVDYWRPVNVLSVHSSGVKISEEAQWHPGTLLVSLSTSYSYTRSVNDETAGGQNVSLNKQVIYTPEHLAAASLHFGYKSWNAEYTHTYTGLRYTTSDNLQSLPYFTVADAFLSFRLPVKKFIAEFRAGARNIFNESYQVISYRPMPLRSWTASVDIQFKSTK